MHAKTTGSGLGGLASRVGRVSGNDSGGADGVSQVMETQIREWPFLHAERGEGSTKKQFVLPVLLSRRKLPLEPLHGTETN